MRICEHSIDETLLKPGFVLDGGCGVDFCFSSALSNMGMKVIAVDPNPKIVSVPSESNIFYERKALSGKKAGPKELLVFQDNDAATIIQGQQDILTPTDVKTVETVTLDEIMEKYSVSQFEVLKLDIEGAEYELLDSITGPIAKQITVEFHDFRNLNPCFPDNERYYKSLLEKLGKWYKVVKHEIEVHRGMPTQYQKNYWDSLFILK